MVGEEEREGVEEVGEVGGEEEGAGEEDEDEDQEVERGGGRVFAEERMGVGMRRAVLVVVVIVRVWGF